MILQRSFLAAFLIVFGLSFAARAETQRPIYFPFGTWPAEENWSPAELALFKEHWYGNQLFAMNEPSLARSKLADGSVVVRLLVLPSFTPALAIRVERHADGLAELEATLLNGAGGYEPGEVDQRYSKDLYSSEMDRLTKRMEAMSLMDGGQLDKNDSLCSDGTMFVLETARQAYFRAVDVHECQALSPTWALIYEIMELVPELEPHCIGCLQRNFEQ